MRGISSLVLTNVNFGTYIGVKIHGRLRSQ